MFVGHEALGAGIAFGVAALMAAPPWARIYAKLIQDAASQIALLGERKTTATSAAYVGVHRARKNFLAAMQIGNTTKHHQKLDEAAANAWAKRVPGILTGLVDAASAVAGVLLFLVGVIITCLSLSSVALTVLLAICSLLILTIVIASIYSGNTRGIASILAIVNTLAMAISVYAIQQHVTYGPVAIPAATEILTKIKVENDSVHDSNQPLSKYTVTGHLRRDPSALAGRSIWVANRKGVDLDLNELHWDAYSSRPCIVDGNKWVCHISIGQDHERGEFSVYVFLANAITAEMIIQGKVNFEKIRKHCADLPQDYSLCIANLTISPEDRTNVLSVSR